MKSKLFKMAVITFLGLLSFNGCGGGSSSSVTDDNESILSFHINSVASSTITRNIRTVRSDNVVEFPKSESSSIASGKPDYMKIYIKSIKLKSEDKDKEDAVIFKSEKGKAIKINNGNVDISELFQANIDSPECFYDNNQTLEYEGKSAIVFNENNGTVVIKEYRIDENNNTIIGNVIKQVSCTVTNSQNLAIPEGKYDKIEVQFFRRAQIEGCVSATFQTTGTKEGIAGYHKYCTQTGKSTFTGIATQNIDFENKTPELMDVDLKVLDGITTDKTETFNVDYDIKGGIELKKGFKKDLTLLFDLNRMLRYFNDGRIDEQPVNPTSPTHMTYFFTLDMQRDNASYAFVGKVGKMYGYEIVLEGCSNNDAEDNGSHVCPSDINTSIVSLWMTSVFDQNGNHIVTSFIPDDNNAWTVIKGSTNGVNNPITQNADGTINITYTINGSEYGTIYNFKYLKNIDDINLNSVFTGFNHSYGKLYIRRKL